MVLGLELLKPEEGEEEDGGRVVVGSGSGCESG